MSAPAHVEQSLNLRTDRLDYHLPEDLIAQYPVIPRDASRLLVLHRADGRLEHRQFSDLPEYLSAGDCLVKNTTRVRHARLLGHRETGGKVEILLIRPLQDHTWEAMGRPASRLNEGERIQLEGSLSCEIVAILPAGKMTVRLITKKDVEQEVAKFGHVPLPPYIDRPDEPEDVIRYQTVYANELGAVAAPTAGLHFTPELLKRLSDSGVSTADMILHVGPGTFKPVTTEYVSEHQLDAEWTEVSRESRSLITKTRQNGHRVVAVGTTSVRGLETMAQSPSNVPFATWTDLLIMPPYKFLCVGSMITNFHLPRSSLLALVGAFAGLDLILKTYEVAVKEKYRFYSYGDAMLIL